MVKSDTRRLSPLSKLNKSCVRLGVLDDEYKENIHNSGTNICDQHTNN